MTRLTHQELITMCSLLRRLGITELYADQDEVMFAYTNNDGSSCKFSELFNAGPADKDFDPTIFAQLAGITFKDKQ